MAVAERAAAADEKATLQRYLDLILAGLRPTGTPPAGGHAPTNERMRTAMTSRP